jgi:pimeloyl-ACP methyl ester carboxylesterase
MNAASQPEVAPGEAAPQARRAIVFIPGGGRRPWEASMLSGFAARMRDALERNAPAPLRYSSAESIADLPEAEGRVDRSTLSLLKADGASEGLADIYVLDLPQSLLAPYQKAGLSQKALRMGMYLPFLFGRLILRRQSRPKGWRQSAFLLAAAAAVVLLSITFLAFLLILIAGLLETVGDLGIFNTASTQMISMAGLISLGFSNLPPRIKERLEENLTILLAALSYFFSAQARPQVMGSFASFLEALTQRYAYERVDVVSYSLGSLISLDLLFARSSVPYTNAPVHSLVTVGCPADLFATIWPEYFQERYARIGAPRHWLNFFEPSDILASNFINADDAAETLATANRHASEWGIEMAREEGELRALRRPDENVSYSWSTERGVWASILTTANAHRTYWDPAETTALSVFDRISRQLFLSDEAPQLQEPELPALP